MTDVKFRAWDGTKMHLPEYSDDNDFYIAADGQVRFTKEVGKEGHTIWLPRQDWILMQYIGLKDKNDNEIYEDDIILSFSEEGTPFYSLVKWDTDNCCFYGTSFISEGVCLNNFGYRPARLFPGFEVVGNIYQNQELITQKPK